MFERFTDSSRQVLVLAQEESRLLRHSFIGTEHILLGLLHQDGAAAQVLIELGASLTTVRERAAETIGLTGGPGSPPFTPRAKRVLELALREAMQLGAESIDTEHILLGLVREGEGVGVQLLMSLGIRPSQVRQRVIQHLSGLHREGRSGNPGSIDLPSDDDEYGGRVVRCSFCGLTPPASGRLVSGHDDVHLRELRRRVVHPPGVEDLEPTAAWEVDEPCVAGPADGSGARRTGQRTGPHPGCLHRQSSAERRRTIGTNGRER